MNEMRKLPHKMKLAILSVIACMFSLSLILLLEAQRQDALPFI
jgi:hypothetical protein